MKVGDLNFELKIKKEQIQQRVAELGSEICADYQNKTPVFLGVLSGSFMFLGDLMKVITLPAEVSFVKLASYEGEKSSGTVQTQLGLTLEIAGRDVIIVEDIVDSGHTMAFLLQMLQQERPQSIRICSLLYKPQACQHDFEELNYVGFEIPNDFVVGYGLDYNGLGRNLKDIYQLAAN